jgi:hypothetical protein
MRLGSGSYFELRRARDLAAVLGPGVAAIFRAGSATRFRCTITRAITSCPLRDRPNPGCRAKGPDVVRSRPELLGELLVSEPVAEQFQYQPRCGPALNRVRT